MTLSLLHVKSSEKHLVTLIGKDEIKIGSTEEADVIVNHPHFKGNTEVLGCWSSTGHPLPGENRKAPSIFPFYSFETDGLSVRMIKLNALRIVLIFVFIIFFTRAALGPGKGASSVAQDWTSIELPSLAVHGFCLQDRTHREGVRFSFQANKLQPYKLRLTAGGRGDGSKIALSLNGKAISKPLPLPSGWGEEMEIPLPAAAVVIGKNILKVHPVHSAAGITDWGISGIRALPASLPNRLTTENINIKPEIILEALRMNDIRGQELAHYYKIIRSWDTPVYSKGSRIDTNIILGRIEQRMRDELHRIAFEVRSKRVQGEEKAEQQLLNDTKGWIPEGWAEGWEIFDGLCH